MSLEGVSWWRTQQRPESPKRPLGSQIPVLIRGASDDIALDDAMSLKYAKPNQEMQVKAPLHASTF